MGISKQIYISSLGTIFGLSILVFPTSTFANSTVTLTGCYERLLKVTAYYTPEATQGVYFNGDFVIEKKINGGNQHGASGRETFNGMLAGPKKFPFGTTVEIPGLGLGGIYDRGSAIISTDTHDVIDVWAGAGLQGMVNALWRGSKTLTGTICPEGFNTQKQEFDWTNYPTWDKASKQMLWTLNMEEGNLGYTVYYLQGFLKQLGYLSSSHILTQNFGSVTKKALCQFQQESLGLSADDEYCGYYGTKTRKKFSDLVKLGKISIENSSGLSSSVTKNTTINEKKVIKKKRILSIR